MKNEFLHIVHGNTNKSSHYGDQYRDYSKQWNKNSTTIYNYPIPGYMFENNLIYS